MHLDVILSSLFGQNCLIFLLSIKFVACFVIVAVIMWIVVAMVGFVFLIFHMLFVLIAHQPTPAT